MNSKTKPNACGLPKRLGNALVATGAICSLMGLFRFRPPAVFLGLALLVALVYVSIRTSEPARVESRD